jgi:hypothetical protein
MLSKLKVLLMISSLLLSGFLLLAHSKADATSNDVNYVKLEAKGKLIMEGVFYAVQTSDGIFPNPKLLVILERVEDKNRQLDRYLEGLEGKTVIAHGLLDIRRVGLDKGTLYLDLRNEEQISIAENK